MERLADAHELLDGPLDAAQLAGNLRDLTRVNRLLGGAELSWRALRLALGASFRGHATLLDVGTGAADIPRYLARRGTASGLTLHITATDVRSEIVDVARERSAGTARLSVDHAADMSQVPDDSYDVVHASLLLHHLEPGPAGELLGEMGRVARRAVIVNDLDRARRWWLAAWLLSRIAPRHRYTRNDAPLPVRRAYRPNELSALAAGAGLREIGRLRDRLGHRYVLVLRPATRTAVARWAAGTRSRSRSRSWAVARLVQRWLRDWRLTATRSPSSNGCRGHAGGRAGSTRRR
ncbi:hypothetical protein BH24CHL5_BH24CHL5_13280 [soil metagenome]